MSESINQEETGAGKSVPANHCADRAPENQAAAEETKQPTDEEKAAEEKRVEEAKAEETRNELLEKACGLHAKKTGEDAPASMWDGVSNEDIEARIVELEAMPDFVAPQA